MNKNDFPSSGRFCFRNLITSYLTRNELELQWYAKDWLIQKFGKGEKK